MTTPRIIRKREVVAKTGLGLSSIDKLEKEGKFPVRLVLGPRATGWYDYEIDEWIAQLPRANAKQIEENK